MNSSNIFRSHLMQQFSAAARNQSRPPLAMMPWISGAQVVEAEDTRGTTNHSEFNDISAIGSTVSSSQHQGKQKRSHKSGRQAHNWSSVSASGRHPSVPHLYPAKDGNMPSKPLSSVAGAEETTNQDPELIADQVKSGNHPDQTESDPDPFARNLQTLMRTRRTTSHFATNMHADKEFWEQALDRAAACGRRAPNHKRTEPFVFKRLLAPSTATERLAEIAYHVTLNKSRSEGKAQKKRDKWSQIPAYLVAMMRPSINIPQTQEHGQLDDELSSGCMTTSRSDAENLYEPLPFVPLQTEREAEDYASVCAAVQNVLLSLHAESLATKWATGKVIQTEAFRQLVGATDPRDRIVALVMIGFPKEDDNDNLEVQSPKPRRFRRDWKEFLQDVS